MERMRLLAVLLLVLAIALGGWIFYEHGFGRKHVVRFATTTSLYASGLLDLLASEFRKNYGNAEVVFIAVGTGQALRLAERGDVCGVLVHDPHLEKLYIDRGVLDAGVMFAYNFFVVVGPRSDPANVSTAGSAVEAFTRIFRAAEAGKALFVSRGDSSGTHQRETMLWKKAGLDPAGRSWYLECGCGMGEALLIANEERAYTLSDIATFERYKKSGRVGDLEVLYANSSDLYTLNIYSGYVTKRCSGVERDLALKFLEFVYENQKTLVENFGVDELDRKIFFSAIDREDELKSLWNAIAGSQDP